MLPMHLCEGDVLHDKHQVLEYIHMQPVLWPLPTQLKWQAFVPYPAASLAIWRSGEHVT